MKYTYNPEDDPINQDPSGTEQLVLRYLRLADDAYAFDIPTIHRKILRFQDRREEITSIETAGAVKLLLRRGYIFQANNQYYAITREGRHYINAAHPLFKVVHSSKGTNHETKPKIY